MVLPRGAAAQEPHEAQEKDVAANRDCGAGDMNNERGKVQGAAYLVSAITCPVRAR